jgi:hypothetical protein
MTPDRDKNLLGTGSSWIESITALITIAKLEKKSIAESSGARALLK